MEAGSSREHQRKILTINLFLSFASSVIFFSLVLNLFNLLLISSAVNLGGSLLMAGCFYLNRHGRHQQAKMAGILSINLYLFLISYMEGLRSGQYMLFFPLLLALIFVIDLKNNDQELVLTAVVTLLNTALIFILAPYQSKLQEIPVDMYSGLFGTNLALALLFTSAFAYMILKTLENHGEKLLEEKMLADTIYDTSLDAVFIVHAATQKITDCNKRALEMFSVSDKAGFAGTDAGVALGPEVAEHIRAISLNRYNKNSPWYGNMDFLRQNEVLFFAYVNIVPFQHQHDLFCKISILDITEIKVAEFEILKAKEKAEKAARVKSRFLSNMSHELRTPLNAIIGTTNILLEEECLETQNQSFEVLRHSSEHMLQLVNDILDFSKLESDKMQLESSPFNLKNFLTDAIRPFRGQGAQDNVSWIAEIDDRLNLEVNGDEMRLNQVMNNLLSNARKFTEKGSITITARCEELRSDALQLFFSVRDTGIGIPAGKVRQIFESFTQADPETTRKYGGTGLGLAISRAIVMKMGGDIRVKSEPGWGSEFYFTIDLILNTKPRAYVNRETQKELMSLEGLRILIAEDNPVNMLVARRFLNKWKITVDEAVDGRKALEIFTKNSFDLVLLDLEMPEMDGTQVVAAIRETNPSIPVVAFTAAVYEGMQSDLISKGFSDFIPKPFRPEELHKKILQLTAYDQLQKYRYG